jgi:hypothetical protein
VGRALPGEIFESSLLHELWHAYQGVQGRTLRFSERETEAHLAQSDYLWHVKPELLDEDHWIKVFAGKDGEFIQKFFFPGRLMASLVAPAASAEQIEAALTEARPRYLAARLLARVALNEVVVQLQQEVSRQKPDKVKEIIFERVERALAAVRARPLIAHFSSAGASEAGSLGASREVATFSTTVMVLAAGFSNGGKISEAERQINHYILDVWGYELSDLVNSDVVDRRD